MTPQRSKQIKRECGTFYKTNDWVFARSLQGGIKRQGLLEIEKDIICVTTKCNSWILLGS